VKSAQTDHLAPADLAGYEVDPVRGFLPSPDPLDRLPQPFASWEAAAGELPKLLVTGTVRSLLEQLPRETPNWLKLNDK
jgi:hypothetical protein